ncbi:TPR repeat-containing protein [Streptomyces albus]|uniref:TPR repeat-containing protein n=1 Tax=Streptomyces albus (strain ATCC 21838 / DSM 41398 / FERM P-419 / JCM 4703 / NBRC 107858) TaxID=1081613 RepID=A0A0B5F3K4_STRA4|nr:TPR repeat-containing protein [Streptomyces albus]AOU79774.1 TPR repeat-containing protein [Streptomyces albus]
MTGGAGAEEPRLILDVHADAGYAYGVAGGDLHSISGRGPVYQLSVYETESTPGGTPAPEGRGRPPVQPSYLLKARAAVVDFTGRRSDVDDLTGWLRDAAGDGGAGGAEGPDRAVRWLHAPGGQGKTRLAAHLAAKAVRSGWKVLTAEQTLGRVDGEPASARDLRIGKAAGLLVLVDYADRWPLAHLAWLFSNQVLRQQVPVRVLLLARTTHTWPALRHALTQAGWPPEACLARGLGPLREEHSRQEMFQRARDCFARHYGLTHPESIPVPDWLSREEFGLTLAVHMAALVAVDRRARSAPEPAAPHPAPDGGSGPEAMMTRLTTHLLERERHHWATLYDGGTVRTGDDPAGGRTPFGTCPKQLSRVVFTAALTGALGYREARAVLGTAGLGADPDRLLDDHAYCYPPSAPGTVLEPLYPDRLAEDFLAVSLPGHDHSGYSSDPWTDGLPALLLGARTAEGELPAFAARTVIFLAAASERWPHLLGTLESLEPLLPEEPRDELTIACADLAERLAEHRLAQAADAAGRAAVHAALGIRLDAAERHDRALAAHREALVLYRELASADLAAFGPLLAETAARLGGGLMASHVEGEVGVGLPGFPERVDGRAQEAIAVVTEAVGTMHRLAELDPAGYESDLASSLGFLALVLRWLGRPEEALAPAREAVAVHRRLGRENPEAPEDELALMLQEALAPTLLELRREEALDPAREAVEIFRGLAARDPDGYGSRLVGALEALAEILHRLGRTEESLAVLEEEGRLRGRPPAESGEPPRLAAFRTALSVKLWVLGKQDEAMSVLRETAEDYRRRAADGSFEQGRGLLYVLANLAYRLEQSGQTAEALAVHREMARAARRLARHDPEFAEDEHGALAFAAADLVVLGRWREALAVVAETAPYYRKPGSTGGPGGMDASLSAVIDTVCKKVAGLDQEEAPGVFTGTGPEYPETLRGFVSAYRRLEHEDPAAHGPARAAALKLLLLWDTERGDWGRASASAREGAEVRRRLAGEDPAGHEPGLALALRRLTDVLLELGDWQAAEEAAREAVALTTRLAAGDPPEHEPGLAAVLALQAEAREGQGRFQEALHPATRSVLLLENLLRTSEDPAYHRPNLTAARGILARISSRTDARAAP